MLQRLGRSREARLAYKEAIILTDSAAEQDVVRRRLETMDSTS